MENHSFIFSPGTWLGEGKIRLNMVEDELAFFTRWKIAVKDATGSIECTQELQIRGFSEVMWNRFVFFEEPVALFSLLMENHALGKLQGKGFVKEDLIGWEFRDQDSGFEGFELYEKQSEELYRMQGEFATADDLRTVIYGRVWRQKIEEDTKNETK